mgnify:CR=1 FL=1
MFVTKERRLRNLFNVDDSTTLSRTLPCPNRQDCARKHVRKFDVFSSVALPIPKRLFLRELRRLRIYKYNAETNVYDLPVLADTVTLQLKVSFPICCSMVWRCLCLTVVVFPGA